MKLYRVTFADIERGKVVRWARNKALARAAIKDEQNDHELCSHLLTERVEVPETKAAFITWLNDNCGGAW